MREKKRPIFSEFSYFSRKVTGEEVVFLCVPKFALDRTLWKVFGSLQTSWDIILDANEKSWHSQDNNVTPIT